MLIIILFLSVKLTMRELLLIVRLKNLVILELAIIALAG